MRLFLKGYCALCRRVKYSVQCLMVTSLLYTTLVSSSIDLHPKSTYTLFQAKSSFSKCCAAVASKHFSWKVFPAHYFPLLAYFNFFKEKSALSITLNISVP